MTERLTDERLIGIRTYLGVEVISWDLISPLQMRDVARSLFAEVERLRPMERIVETAREWAKTLLDDNAEMYCVWESKAEAEAQTALLAALED